MTRECNCPPGSAFHWRGDSEGDFVPLADWSAFRRYGESSAKQTAHIERKLAQGAPVPSVPMFSRKDKG